MLSATFLLLSLLVGSPAAPALGAGAGSDPADTVFVRQAHRRLTFQFDQRYSMVDSRLAGIDGLKLGVEWRGRYRAGGGLYLLSRGVRTVTNEVLPPGTHTELRFRYAAAYAEYVIRGNPRWEVSVPVQLGYGRYYHETVGPAGDRTRSINDRVWLLEPTIGGHYRVFRWIGLGGGVGWREAFSVKAQYANQLNGPIFYGRAKLFLGDFYKVVRGRQRLLTQRGLRRRDWATPTLDDTEAE